MTENEFLETLDPERKVILSKLRALILKLDRQVVETVSKMMGQEMLYYTVDGVMKYALASPKAHMSFHSLVLHSTGALREKYILLLPKAKFQKGCINFKKAEEIPFEIMEQMMIDSAKVKWPPQIYLDRMKKNKQKSQTRKVISDK